VSAADKGVHVLARIDVHNVDAPIGRLVCIWVPTGCVDLSCVAPKSLVLAELVAPRLVDELPECASLVERKFGTLDCPARHRAALRGRPSGRRRT
jgi:hypothetical protein